jgi:hypothetical protein
MTPKYSKNQTVFIISDYFDIVQTKIIEVFKLNGAETLAVGSQYAYSLADQPCKPLENEIFETEELALEWRSNL